MKDEKDMKVVVVEIDLSTNQREMIQSALSRLEKSVAELGSLSFDFMTAVGAVLSPDVMPKPENQESKHEKLSPIELQIEIINDMVAEQIIDMKEYIRRVRC